MMVLAAFCIACMIILSAILAHKMAVERLGRLVDRWLPTLEGSHRQSVSPLRRRSEVPVYADRASTGDDRPRTTVARSLGNAAEERGQALRSAEVLPFVRKPLHARPPLLPFLGQPGEAA